MFFGFNSFKEIREYFTKYIGSNATGILTLIALIGNFIEQFIYTSSGAIFFLWALYFTDFLTGIAVAIFIKKDFRSKHFPRFLVGLFFGTVLISISFNAGIYSLIYSYLGSTIYAVLIGQNIISIFENAAKFNVIPNSVILFLKEKISPSALIKRFKKDENKP
tara:strand:- start:267 stop:755 length:489 start_codon:yes stop_codon:yes gene_type:complete